MDVSHVIDEITRDCFGAIIQLRRLESVVGPDPQTLHGRLCWFVDQMIQKGQAAGLTPEDLGDVAYAVIALADEVAIGVPALRDFWMYNLLQLRYFNENVAGENFFYRLDLLKQNPKPTRDQIIEHMSANICRCGTYQRIVRAVERAAQEA